MEYRTLGKSATRVSVIGLGGHEYHPDGRLKGFSENLEAAVRPGYTNPEFGSPNRKALVQYAVKSGINYFDVTIDPEVKALGQCLPLKARDSVLVQSRPQAMCYQYDAGNRGLADPSRLQSEVERLIGVSGRDRIDVLNFGFEATALADETYLNRLGKNIHSLKQADLIRFAACDSMRSGEEHYLRMMQTGLFDIVWLNFGPLCPFPAQRIFPLAKKLGMGVAVREAFSKGKLFRAAEDGGVTVDRAALAVSTIRWILSHPEISTLVVGVRNVAELESNLAAASGKLTDEDSARLDVLRGNPAFIRELAEQERAFRKGLS